MELELSQKQKQVLTQKMQQSLKILQMNTLDLGQHIQEEALENPLLEVEGPEQEEDPSLLRLKKLEWLDRMDDSNTFRYDVRGENSPREVPLYEKKLGDSLEEVLLLQVPGFKLPPAREGLVRRLIGDLDDNGYLAFPADQLARSLQVSPGELEDSLAILHRMDPPGVGARDLRECLLIQARRVDPPSPVLIRLIEGHLDTLAKNRLDKLAAALGVSLEEVKEARERLLELNPKPGNGYSAYNAIPYIRPDLFVVHFQSGFQVIYNDYDQPKVGISSFYRNLRGEGDAQADAYIRERLQKAELLISSISQRKKTILACAKAILERQNRFFRLGPGHLAPMTLGDVAGDLEIHPSTVSRAVSGKYLQCQWGVWALGDFFSRNVSKQSDATSQDMAITQLRRIIEEESPQKPFSDQKLAEKLVGCGISISRRTVAKYRDLAGIPPASGRKQF